MDTSAAVAIALLLGGIYFWKKQKDYDFLLLLIPIGIVLLLSIFQWFSEAYLDLNLFERHVESKILLGLKLIAFIAFIAIACKDIFKK